MAENDWFKHDSGECPVVEGTAIDVKYRDGEIKEGLPALRWSQGRDAQDAFWNNDSSENDIVAWRFHKPEQSLDEALGSVTGIDALKYSGGYTYPQTSFKPSSEAQLRSDEAARISKKLSDKLTVIAFTACELTGKSFSPTDIKLVKDLLESVEEYEENK